jgi:hypothetical protein
MIFDSQQTGTAICNFIFISNPSVPSHPATASQAAEKIG